MLVERRRRPSVLHQPHVHRYAQQRRVHDLLQVPAHCRRSGSFGLLDHLPPVLVEEGVDGVSCGRRRKISPALGHRPSPAELTQNAVAGNSVPDLEPGPADFEVYPDLVDFHELHFLAVEKLAALQFRSPADLVWKERDTSEDGNAGALWTSRNSPKEAQKSPLLRMLRRRTFPDTSYLPVTITFGIFNAMSIL